MKALFLKLFFFILCSAIGLLFIYSGYTKLYPIEPFEYTFVDIGIANWKTAPFIARFMIGLEFFIGLALILCISLKKFTLRLAAYTLIVFNIYLIIMLFKEGNNGNCGCFGNAIAMTPLQALIKNIILLILIGILYMYYEGFELGKFKNKLLVILFVASMGVPHILNYVDMSYSQAYLTPKEDQFKLELDSLYNNATQHTPPKSLSTGKHIISFMSLSCSHCRIAAKKLRLIKEKNPAIPMYLVLNGDTSKLKPFFEDTKATNIKFCILGAKPFVYLAGVDLPAIYMVNNSVVEHWIEYPVLDQSEIEKWLTK